MTTNKLQVGERAKDSISGFEGIIFGITEYLHGCRHILLKPDSLGKEGKPAEGVWFDEPQCERVEAETLERSGDTGGPSLHSYPDKR